MTHCAMLGGGRNEAYSLCVWPSKCTFGCLLGDYARHAILMHTIKWKVVSATGKGEPKKGHTSVPFLLSGESPVTGAPSIWKLVRELAGELADLVIPKCSALNTHNLVVLATMFFAWVGGRSSLLCWIETGEWIFKNKNSSVKKWKWTAFKEGFKTK